MPDTTAQRHALVRQALSLQRPERMPTLAPIEPGAPPDLAWVEYRPDVYHLGEPDVAPEPGEVAISRDGRRKVTRDGGVWAVDARERYRDEQDVLNADPQRFEVERVGPEMLAPMSAMIAAAAEQSFALPMHYGTLVTRATIEFGWEPFLTALALDPLRLARLLGRFGEASLAVVEGWARTPGAELIVFHDDLAGTRGPVIGPRFLRVHVFPWYERLFAAIHRGGRKVLYLSDGCYLPLLDDLLALGPDGLYVESSSMAPSELLPRAGRDRLFLIKTNSRTMDFGSPEDIRRELEMLRDMHQDFPGMMIYAGGGDPSAENAEAFRRGYRELLVYG